MMLAAVKLARQIQTEVFDPDLRDLIIAGIKDIQHAGPRFTFSEVTDQETGEVTDYVITDPLVKRAVITYVLMNFGNPDNYDRLKKSYDEQKGQLRESSGYGMEVVG